MPYVYNSGVRVHYHVEGEGPPLVLQHGGIGSMQDWYDTGYVARLKSSHRLILIDTRGHGLSDKLYRPESYELKPMVGDIVAVLDSLKVGKTHFMGYSMGGRLGFGLAAYAPEYLRSLIIGAMEPYKHSLESIRQVLDRGMEAFIAEIQEQGIPVLPGPRGRLLANDVQALQAAAAVDLPDISFVLPTIKVPCLVYVGQADEDWRPGTIECVKHIPNCTYVSLPGLSHLQAYVRSDLVLPYVIKFLQSIDC